MLLELDFISLFDYFSLLDYSCHALSRIGPNALIYLAAAVSDFYLPRAEMSLHKIQSNAHDSLHLDLKPVPKLLGRLKSEWCPRAFVVSFKLETDESILMAKSRQALERYGHQVVVGNVLEKRKGHVVVLESSGKASDIEVNVADEKRDIEELLVKSLRDLHDQYLLESK